MKPAMLCVSLMGTELRILPGGLDLNTVEDVIIAVEMLTSAAENLRSEKLVNLLVAQRVSAAYQPTGEDDD